MGTGTQWPPHPSQTGAVVVCLQSLFSSFEDNLCVFPAICISLFFCISMWHRFTSVVLSLFCIPSWVFVRLFVGFLPWFLGCFASLCCNYHDSATQCRQTEVNGHPRLDASIPGRPFVRLVSIQGSVAHPVSRAGNTPRIKPCHDSHLQNQNFPQSQLLSD